MSSCGASGCVLTFPCFLRLKHETFFPAMEGIELIWIHKGRRLQNSQASIDDAPKISHCTGPRFRSKGPNHKNKTNLILFWLQHRNVSCIAGTLVKTTPLPGLFGNVGITALPNSRVVFSVFLVALISFYQTKSLKSNIIKNSFRRTWTQSPNINSWHSLMNFMLVLLL